MKEDIEKNINYKWHEVEVDKMKKYDEKEVEKANQEKEKIKQQMGMINHQFREYKTKRILEYQDQVVEGQVIKKAAMEAVEEEKYNYNNYF